MKTRLHPVFIHIFVIALFILAAVLYFSPVLQGKTILQSDIIQYTGMAKEQNDFRDRNGEEPYWTNSAFGGMPTYQLGANYPHNYIKDLDRTIRFLPRPADYLFLYLIGFYILLCCMKVDYGLAVLGALAFGFSTYLIIILGVGHNAKAHAIAYLPVLLGGILLTFRKKYLWGFLLTAFAMALEVNANHYQMTFYFMLLVLVLGLVFLVDAIRAGKLKHFAISTGLLILAVFLGVLANATSLMATREYAEWSTRGKTALQLDPQGNPLENRDGLDREYITQYSYGIAESLNLFIPRLFGGSNSEDLGTESETFEYLTEQGLPRTRALEFTSGLPLYWGEQPIVAAPAYVGAVVLFLFFLGVFLVKDRSRWWLLGGALLALMLSWGKNFPLLTNFMIDYFPFYDKFRAVSSVQVVLELCVPVLAVLGIRELLSEQRGQEEKLKALKAAFFIAGGLCVSLLIFKGSFDFRGLSDDTYRQYFGEEILAMIRSDRESVYVSDVLRTLVFVVVAAVLLGLGIKRKLKTTSLLAALALLIVIDLVGVDRRYVNNDDFVSKRRMREPFRATGFDRQILQDSSHFRVFDTQEGLNGARTSYFHQSIGGYHAAKPRRMQELFDYHVYRNNRKVLNMLNVKYLLQPDEEGRKKALLNPDALGNAWFVEELYPVATADQEIRSLDTLDVRNSAVFNAEEFPEIRRTRFLKDTAAQIRLADYKPNHLTYEVALDHPAFAVFSEMYYPHGWNAYIDGDLAPQYRVNYTLRGLRLPEGKYQVVFRFEPEVVEEGSKITLATNILLGILLLGGIIFTVYRKKKQK